MKFLFAAVPQWYPVSPYLAGALLAGQLKNSGFEAETYDFNIEFFNDILSVDYLEKSLEKAKKFLSEEEAFQADESYGAGIKIKLRNTFEIRKNIIKDYFKADNGNAEKTIEEIEWAISVFKTKELFYDPEKLYRAKDIISDALDIASLPFVPSRIMLDNFIANPIFTYDFKDVDYQCKHESVNMFLPYFEKKLSEKDFSEYDLIALSVTDLSQLVPGLTLARLLKKHTKAKIAIGGNYIYKIEEDLKKIPQIFEEYCDYLSIGDGETATVELAEYIAGKRKIEDVHSLVYSDEGSSVKTNSRAPVLNLERVAYPDFEGYDFSKYFSPETVAGKGLLLGKM